MERLSKEVENEAKEERFQARKQKLSYKNGLDEQVARKRIKWFLNFMLIIPISFLPSSLLD